MTIQGLSAYGCHSSSVYHEAEDYEEALEWALLQPGMRKIRLKKWALSNITVEVDEASNVYKDGEIELFMETVITAKAIGNQAIVSMNV